MVLFTAPKLFKVDGAERNSIILVCLKIQYICLLGFEVENKKAYFQVENQGIYLGLWTSKIPEYFDCKKSQGCRFGKRQSFVNETHAQKVSKVWPIMVDKKMQFSNSTSRGDKMETTICHFG